MARALIEARGIKSIAARNLGCGWRTVDNYCKKYKTVQNALEEARNTIVDVAESKLLQKLNAADNWAIGKVLNELGRDRGWGQAKGTSDDPIKLIVEQRYIDE